MIKAVIFDMGGVVVDLDAPGCINNFKTRAGFDTIEDYLDCWHQKGFISDMEEGKTTPEDFYRESISRSRPGTTAETIRECFCSLLVRLNPSAVRLIQELRGRYSLYVLSNNNPITVGKFHDMLAEAGLPSGEVFEDEFYSCFMRLLKPGREIYDEVIRRVGVKPEEILFIDDSQTNVEAAKAAGIKALWLQNGQDVHTLTRRVLAE